MPMLQVGEASGPLLLVLRPLLGADAGCRIGDKGRQGGHAHIVEGQMLQRPEDFFDRAVHIFFAKAFGRAAGRDAEQALLGRVQACGEAGAREGWDGFTTCGSIEWHVPGRCGETGEAQSLHRYFQTVEAVASDAEEEVISCEVPRAGT